MMSADKTGLGTQFANLGKPQPKPPPPSPANKPEANAAKSTRAATAAKPKPVGGRKVTVRDISDEDLRRLAEFRYTHGLTIQALAIEGLSLSLRARGLKALSGADTGAIDALLAKLAR